MGTIYKYGTEVLAMAVIALLWLGGALLLRYVVPQYGFGWVYHLIPVLFLILTFVAMVLCAGWEYEVRTGRVEHSAIVNRYMAWKGIKVGVCLLFIAGYWLISGNMFNYFLLTFMIFYVVSLAMESMLFMKMQRNISRAAQNPK